jgi:hypothetical protein
LKLVFASRGLVFANVKVNSIETHNENDKQARKAPVALGSWAGLSRKVLCMYSNSLSYSESSKGRELCDNGERLSSFLCSKNSLVFTLMSLYPQDAMTMPMMRAPADQMRDGLQTPLAQQSTMGHPLEASVRSHKRKLAIKSTSNCVSCVNMFLAVT